MFGKHYDIPQEITTWILKIQQVQIKYPKDLDDAVYYIFKTPPGALIPAENDLLTKCNFYCVFVFGEHDLMDRDGAIRLASISPNRFKIYEIAGRAHYFPIESPTEITHIMDVEF